MQHDAAKPGKFIIGLPVPAASAVLVSLVLLNHQLAGSFVDVGQPALAGLDLLLDPRDELGAQDVDPPLQQAAAVRDLVLLGLEVVDQRAESVVRERCEIGKRFHGRLSVAGRSTQ
jgi:hypothetical protein